MRFLFIAEQALNAVDIVLSDSDQKGILNMEKAGLFLMRAEFAQVSVHPAFPKIFLKLKD